MEPYLSIIIPAYNEKANFQKGTLVDMKKLLTKVNFTWEVIVVDDGSTDGSIELLEKFVNSSKGIRLVKNIHTGKAGTVARGVEEAKGEYILFTDFDQATPILEFEKLQPYLETGFDVVIGSREVAGAKREKEPFYRHLMGKGFNFGVKLIAIRGFSDTQCGFKAFKTEIAKKLFKKLQVYRPKKIASAFTGAFDVEILFIAKKMKLKVAEVPIHWKHIETTRVSPLKDSIHMAWDVVKIRIYDLMGRYQ